MLRRAGPTSARRHRARRWSKRAAVRHSRSIGGRLCLGMPDAGPARMGSRPV